LLAWRDGRRFNRESTEESFGLVPSFAVSIAFLVFALIPKLSARDFCI